MTPLTTILLGGDTLQTCDVAFTVGITRTELVIKEVKNRLGGVYGTIFLEVNYLPDLITKLQSIQKLLPLL
jgi:hypothetical protein